MKSFSIFLFLSLSISGSIYGQEKIIDIHMHAGSFSPGSFFCAYQTDPLSGARLFSENSSMPCECLLKAPESEQELLKQVVIKIKQNNIVYAVISGLDRKLLKEWKAALPETFIMGTGADPLTDGIDSVRNMIIRGECKVLGELGTQYLGFRLNSPEYEPFLSLAEEYDIPVINHCGPGFPGGSSNVFPKYRASLGNPSIYEDLLVKHPKLRICLAHAGWPFSDEIIAILYNYSNVYVDISWISYMLPKEEFRNYLKRIVDAGFSKRILFGSDLMAWPDVIDLAIHSIRTTDYLTDNQKRDIFYNNAVRFLKLKE